MPLEGNVFFLYWPMLSMPEYIHIVQLKQEKKKIPESYNSKGVLKTSCLALCFWLLLWLRYLIQSST